MMRVEIKTDKGTVFEAETHDGINWEVTGWFRIEDGEDGKPDDTRTMLGNQVLGEFCRQYGATEAGEYIRARLRLREKAVS